MKRKGYIFEEVTSLENCEQAVLEAIKRKKKTRYLRHVRKHYKEYGYKLQQTLLNGWEPTKPRNKVINEGTDRKRRELLIPSLRDHFVHTAVARVLQKHITKRFYFYSCGSLPKRGQTFAIKAIESRIRKKRPKYCLLADIKGFYRNTKKDQVMKCLRRVFKDERFLELNEKILDQMKDGLAIGFTVSHWYAHLVLSFVDEEISKHKIFFVRFMDNFVVLGSNKRKLHGLLNALKLALDKFGLWLKGDYQIFPIRARMVEFLSYRFDYDKTIMRKPLMIRLSRRFRRAKGRLDAHTARTIMSYLGTLKHCDSYNFRKKYVYPNVSIKLCRRLISDADKKRILCRAA